MTVAIWCRRMVIDTQSSLPPNSFSKRPTLLSARMLVPSRCSPGRRLSPRPLTAEVVPAAAAAAGQCPTQKARAHELRLGVGEDLLLQWHVAFCGCYSAVLRSVLQRSTIAVLRALTSCRRLSRQTALRARLACSSTDSRAAMSPQNSTYSEDARSTMHMHVFTPHAVRLSMPAMCRSPPA